MEENNINPYQSPSASLTDIELDDHPQDQSRPSYKLYSVRSIVLATFLGSPLAGGIVMALNYRRLGLPAKAMHSAIWSAVATAALIAIAIGMPDDIKIPNMLFLIAQVLAMFIVATKLQGANLSSHQFHGGRLASAWGAAGIAILCSIVIMIALAGYVLIDAIVFAS
jgi:hypothetical protein